MSYVEKDFEVPIVRQGHEVGTIDITAIFLVFGVPYDVDFKISEIWVRDINTGQTFKATGPFFNELAAWVLSNDRVDGEELAYKMAA